MWNLYWTGVRFPSPPLMTAKELIKLKLIWKVSDKKWARNCPQCNCVIENKCTDDRRGKDTARRGFLKKKKCRKCWAINQKGKLLKPLPEGVFINENGQVCSVCSNCSKINVSKSSSISKAISELRNRENILCAKCCRQTIDLPDEMKLVNDAWTRPCPECEEIIEYKINLNNKANYDWQKYTCLNAINHKKLCKKCDGKKTSIRQTGRKLNPERCKNIGLSKKGEKNPWYGKKRSKEFCHKISEANKGKNNFWYGKTQPKELVHKRMESIQKTKYQRKEYTLPDGNIILLQGYEPSTMDYLYANGKKNILTNVSDMPEIFYQWNNKQHRYYPDGYIKEENLLIETKSTYTWSVDLERNQNKIQAAVDCGFNLLLFIWKSKKILFYQKKFNARLNEN